MWVDPTNEIVGLYFAVTLTGVSTSDLFANAVTAAVDDEHQVPSNFIVVQAGEIIEVGTRR